jgi:hypothetical protein
MTKILISTIVLLTLASQVSAQAPDGPTIQQAMNQGLELEFPAYQQFADVVVLLGGATPNGDFLFLCEGRLMWNVSSTDLVTALQQEISAEVERLGGDDQLWIALNAALSARLSRISAFESGDTATPVKFRVRIEQAGADWIVSQASIKESGRNPLSVLDAPLR